MDKDYTHYLIIMALQRVLHANNIDVIRMDSACRTGSFLKAFDRESYGNDLDIWIESESIKVLISGYPSRSFDLASADCIDIIIDFIRENWVGWRPNNEAEW